MTAWQRTIIGLIMRTTQFMDRSFRLLPPGKAIYIPRANGASSLTAAMITAAPTMSSIRP
jgi:hypothetical protein